MIQSFNYPPFTNLTTTLVSCRFNKHLKNLVKNAYHAEANLARSVNINVAAHFMGLGEAKYKISADPLHRCVLSSACKAVFPTSLELADLRLLGCCVDGLSVSAYKICHVLGQHFRAGEWGCHPRCGSVVTCVIDGRSLYARVNKFLSVDGDSCAGYASVSWFGEPEYPLGNPLVVRVTIAGTTLDQELGCIIRITDIDPSQVIVECCLDKN